MKLSDIAASYAEKIRDEKIKKDVYSVLYEHL